MTREITFPQDVIPLNKVYFCPHCGFIGFFEQVPEKHFDPSIPRVWPCENELVPSMLIRKQSILGRIGEERNRQLRKWSRDQDTHKSMATWLELVQHQFAQAKRSHRKQHLIKAAALIVAMIEVLGPDPEIITDEDPF
jgi:hypothetical protein